MKKTGLLCLVCAVLLLAACAPVQSSTLPSSQPPPASSAVVRAPEQEPELEEVDSFGMLQYVDGEDIFLREGLGFFFGSENEALAEALEGLAYTYFPPDSTWEAGWHGRRLYEMDGYLLSVIMFGISGAQSEEDERLYIGYNILLDEKHVLESGLHVGMTLDEAMELLDNHERHYLPVVDVSEVEEGDDRYYFLCPFHFTEGLFDEYAYCLVFAYQKEPVLLGRTMCMYANEDGVIQAIASPFYVLP